MSHGDSRFSCDGHVAGLTRRAEGGSHSHFRPFASSLHFPAIPSKSPLIHQLIELSSTNWVIQPSSSQAAAIAGQLTSSIKRRPFNCGNRTTTCIPMHSALSSGLDDKKCVIVAGRTLKTKPFADSGRMRRNVEKQTNRPMVVCSIEFHRPSRASQSSKTLLSHCHRIFDCASHDSARHVVELRRRIEYILCDAQLT